MIKLVFTLRRRPDLTRAQFQQHWFERHGPLVRSHAERLRIRRYVQTHAVTHEVNSSLGTSRGSASDYYDGVAELWWDDIETMVEAFSTDAGRAAGHELLEDERRFVDLPNSPLWLGVEHELVGAPSLP